MLTSQQMQITPDLIKERGLLPKFRAIAPETKQAAAEIAAALVANKNP